jgi:hypothetical protein
MNDQSIFVNEAGGDQASGESGASMCQDEIARLFLQSDDFLREIAAGYCGFSPGPQDRCRRCDACPVPNAIRLSARAIPRSE